eukprot:s3206_g2.t1
MPPVDEWVHATSHENFERIERDGFLKGNHCTDDFFDGNLYLPSAPRGTWFNANNYQGRTITKTPYPERNGDPKGKALAFRVSQLLDPQENYQLFKVSEIPREYLQVKYAIVGENDPFFDWCSQHLEPVQSNADHYVSLEWDEGYFEHVWSAEDIADRKVMVNVFIVNNDRRNPSIPLGNYRPYLIHKIPARQQKSPGRLI